MSHSNVVSVLTYNEKRRVPVIHRAILVLFVSMLFVSSSHTRADELPPLKIVDSRIVTPDGERVTLKGCNLGNWLILELWMFNLRNAGVHDEHGLEMALAERFGKEEAWRLMEVWRDNYITERDIELIKSFGMNVLRLPFEYELLEDDAHPMQLRSGAFKHLDRCVEWAEKHEMYVVLDLHGAAGRQNSYAHSGHASQNKFWFEEKYQTRTLWLWGEVAQRYADAPNVLGYEALNEPWHGGEERLLSFIKRWYDKMRPLAPGKILVIPGMSSGVRFYGVPKDHGWENVMFDMHWYPGLFGWGQPTPWQHRSFLDDLENKHYPYAKQRGFPMMHGECNIVYDRAGGGRMTRLYFDAYERFGWVPTIWSYKNLVRKGGVPKDYWAMVANKDPLPDVNFRNSSKQEIETFFKSMSTLELVADEDLRHWLTTDGPTPTIDDLAPLPVQMKSAPVHDAPPAGWTATDVGGARPGGQKVAADGHISLYGAGNDIWGVRDQFRFLHQEVNGDLQIEVVVEGVGRTHSSAKGGIMIRKSLDPASPHVMISIRPDGNPEFLHRADQGGETSSTNLRDKSRIWSGEDETVRLRLVRKGDVVTASYAYNSGPWKEAGSATVSALAGAAQLGLVACSHDNATLVEVDFHGLEP